MIQNFLDRMFKDFPAALACGCRCIFRESLRLFPMLLLFLMIAEGFDAQAQDLPSGRGLHIVPSGALHRHQGPVVIFLHDKGQRVHRFSNIVDIGHHADDGEFAGMFPDAEARAWHDRPDASEADRNYLADLARSLEGRRIIWAGFGNGGLMALRMACAYPDLVDGLALVAVTLPKKFDCPGWKASPVLYFAGGNDRHYPFEGNAQYHSAEGSLDFLAARNSCGEKSLEQRIVLQASGLRTLVERTDYGVCQKKTAGFLVESAGHYWPGTRSDRRLGLGRLGAGDQALDMTEEIVRFFGLDRPLRDR